MILVFVLQVLECLLRLSQNILFPGKQLVSEILALPLVHERLLVARLIGLVLG